jgi:hypothetical protein
MVLCSIILFLANKFDLIAIEFGPKKYNRPEKKVWDIEKIKIMKNKSIVKYMRVYNVSSTVLISSVLVFYLIILKLIRFYTILKNKNSI